MRKIPTNKAITYDGILGGLFKLCNNQSCQGIHC